MDPPAATAGTGLGVPSPSPSLELLDRSVPHEFIAPIKRIHDGADVTAFRSSRAYQQIMTFLFQLNGAMYPRKIIGDEGKETVHTWDLGSSDVVFSESVNNLKELLQKLEDMIDEAPPDPGPRRFGNVSFRRWSQLAEERMPELLRDYLPVQVFTFGGEHREGGRVEEELSAYLLGSFGSAQRLDYGTGHELSFLAFLGCVWMLGGFERREAGVEERGIVLGVVEPYLRLVRRLILTYTLEPAGSHGVWGLDDHSFVPYIFGSAQFSPAIASLAQLPAEGSLPTAAEPGDVAKASVVARERVRNLYFAAVGFIYDVKRGPFWEHSPILFDISGVRAGWAKINRGMIKMYDAEVLSKFPVVQHFPFGSLFPWDRDPRAPPPPDPARAASRPQVPTDPAPSCRARPGSSGGSGGTRAPWANPGAVAGAPAEGMASTRAPWAPSPTATLGVGGGSRGARSTRGSGSDSGSAKEPPPHAPWAASGAGGARPLP